jgi:hypothetical protein
MMENIRNLENVSQPAASWSVPVQGKWLAYGVLVVLALLFRLANVDLVPMDETEAARALSAYHYVFPATPGEAQPAESAITFWWQVIGFSTFGIGEGAARIGGIVAGLLLIVVPLFFERQIGVVRAFVLSVLLAVSPIGFVAARTADPVMWTAVFGLLVVWAGLRLWQVRDDFSAYLFITLFFALLFLVGSSGMLLGVVLLLAAAGTLWWVIWQAPVERDSPGDEVLAEFNLVRSYLPLQRALLIAISVLMMVATGFMLYPAGAGMLVNSLSALTGFFTPSSADAPAFFAIRALMIYESVLLVVGIASLVVLLRGSMSVLDRLMVMWLLVGGLILTVYAGSTAAHALLLVIPLAWLVSGLVERIIVGESVNSVLGSYFSYSRNRQYSLNWLVGLIVLALLMMAGLHLQEVGRGLQAFPTDSSLTVLMEARFAPFRASATWLAITLMLIVVTYLLVGSYRGAYAAFQSFMLGLVLFMVVIGIGTGWNTAVVNSTNPLDFWRTSAPASDTYLLRQTLIEIARRDSRGFPEIPVTIVLDEQAGLTSTGLVAWLVRDFENARFVPSLTDAQRDQIVLLPQTEEDPDLAGSYVGQRFVMRQRWSADTQLRPVDWLGWWTQRRIASGGIVADPAILWLRIDVYDGMPSDQRPQG